MEFLELECPTLKHFGVAYTRVCLPHMCCAGPRAQWTSRTLPSAAKPVPVSTRTGTTPVPSAHSTSPWYHTLSAYIHIIVRMCVIVSCGLSVVGRKPPESVSRQQLAVFFDHLTGMQQVFICGLCALHWTDVLTDVIIQIPVCTHEYVGVVCVQACVCMRVYIRTYM